MSEKENHEGCNCCQPMSNDHLLATQAQNTANLALMWLNKDRIDAAEIHLAATSKLLALSGMKESRGLALYCTARAAIAQKRGHNKAALRHARKAYAIFKKTHAPDHYSLCLAQANFGECLAIAGKKEEGLQIMAEALEKLKAAEVSDNRIDWKESIIKKVAQTLANLS